MPANLGLAMISFEQFPSRQIMKEPVQMAHRISKTGICPGWSVKDQSQLEFSGSAADALQQDHPVAACSMNDTASVQQTWCIGSK